MRLNSQLNSKTNNLTQTFNVIYILATSITVLIDDEAIGAADENAVENQV